MGFSEITTRTGFLEVRITTGEVGKAKLTHFPGPRVTIITRKGVFRIPMEVGERIIIPVTPGTVSVYATLGAVESKKKKIMVRGGQTSKVNFRFGK